MSQLSVFVDVHTSEDRPFTHVPSPRMGGNLGVVVGAVQGADIWMCGRGQDGVVEHQTEGETTYLFRAEVPDKYEVLLGPIVTTLEVKGRVATRDVGPLKALVNLLESRFWAFGDEGEVLAAVRGSISADGAARAARGEAVAGVSRTSFEIPELGDGVRLPPVAVPASEVRRIYDVEHVVCAEQVPIEQAAPYVVRATAALEALENGFPAGAHALGEVETRHHVDVRLPVRIGGRRLFLRWTSSEGFDERSRAHLSPAARGHDDSYKEALAQRRKLRAMQRARYDAEVARLRGMASGLGAQEREEAEIKAFLEEARRCAMSAKDLRQGLEEIRAAYRDKRLEGDRHRRLLGELAQRLRRRWDALLPVEVEEACVGSALEDEEAEAVATSAGTGTAAGGGEERRVRLDLSSPARAFESMLAALRAGDFESFQQTHSDAARLTLTREGFERAVRELATHGPPEVSEFKSSEHSSRVMLKSGRCLTRMRKYGDAWLSIYPWVK
ncbi:MAG: hypothetical protein KatS3mg102_0207 [Planctomycetota bacterium]|nr:MAG: hypothetical protein KatS3mg102_0207 [Planctomycetota bacterium]